MEVINPVTLAGKADWQKKISDGIADGAIAFLLQA